LKYCDACRIAKRNKSCRDCESREPELLPENRATWDLWCAAGTQWRTTGFGIVGLDYGALLKIATIMGIEMNERVMRSIMMLEAETLTAASKKADQRRTLAEKKSG
jgi:hypothetical protein